MKSELHQPVLVEPFLTHIKEIPSIDVGLFVDGTFGRGGHLRAVMHERPQWTFLGIDCDEEAISYGSDQFANEIQAGQLVLARGNFVDLRSVVESAHRPQLPILGILLDLGVSSPQLDQGHRGFSFYQDGPLDMRLDHQLSLTAADIVNTWDEDGLNQLFRELGEVRSPYRVTQKIIETRSKKQLSRTLDLADLIVQTDGWRTKGHHPATQYFMALRLEVNQELSVIQKVLPQAVELLAPTGRLFIITFHSLEDRIVKVALKKFCDDGVGRLVNKKVIQAEWAEKKSNPRSRSAKMRIFEKAGRPLESAAKKPIHADD